MSNMFKMRIPSHLQHISKGLYDLQKKGEICDLCLTSCTFSVDIHQVVLASMGDLAYSKVRTASTSEGPCRIQLKNYSFSALESVIKCLYLGEVEFNKEDVQEIIDISDDLGLTKVSSHLKTHPILSDTKRTRGRKRKQDMLDSVKTSESSMVLHKEPANHQDISSVESDVTTMVKDEKNGYSDIESKSSSLKSIKQKPKQTANKQFTKFRPGIPKKHVSVPNQSPRLQPKDKQYTAKTEDPEVNSKDAMGHSEVPGEPSALADLKRDTNKSLGQSFSNPENKDPPDEAEHVYTSLQDTTEVLHEVKTAEISKVKSEGKGETAVDGPSVNPTKQFKSGSKECYKCHEVFDSPKQCAKHRATCKANIKRCDPDVIKALPFVCRKCLKRFPSKDALNTHRSTCTVKRQRIERKCRKCQITFDDLQELKAHRKIHVKEWNDSYVRIKQYFTCDLCEYRTTNEKSLIVHGSKQHHQPLVGTEKHPVLHCKIPGCSYKTLFKFQLKNHQEMHSSDCSYMCELCGKGFKQRSVLDVHRRIVHKEPRVVCPECAKPLKTKKALEAHIKRVHKQEKNISCPECSFKSFDAVTMESHRHSKHNVPFASAHKIYMCDICGYSTRWRCQYNTHARRHTGECPFVCKVCNKSFPAKSDLTSHTKWHFDKKYKCPHDKCKYSTCVPGKLKIHVRTVHTHRDVKPFVCNVCDYKTNLRSNLNLHLRKVHKLEVETHAHRVAQVTKTAAPLNPPNYINLQRQDIIDQNIQNQNQLLQQEYGIEVDTREPTNTVQIFTNATKKTEVELDQGVCLTEALTSQGSIQLQSQTRASQEKKTQVSDVVDLLSSAGIQPSVKLSRKPIVVKLKSNPGQLNTIQPVQKLQQQPIQQQVPVGSTVQVIGTLTELNQFKKTSLISNTSAHMESVQSESDKVIIDTDTKFNVLTQNPSTPVTSLGSVYPVTVVGPTSDGQMPSYTSLIQVHTDSLGQLVTQQVGHIPSQSEAVTLGNHIQPSVVNIQPVVYPLLSTGNVSQTLSDPNVPTQQEQTIEQ